MNCHLETIKEHLQLDLGGPRVVHQLHALLGRVDLASGVKHVTIDRYNFIIFDQISHAGFSPKVNVCFLYF